MPSVAAESSAVVSAFKTDVSALGSNGPMVGQSEDFLKQLKRFKGIAQLRHEGYMDHLLPLIAYYILRSKKKIRSCHYLQLWEASVDDWTCPHHKD